ncbi:MAG TPA: hypothetical protein ENG94_02500 [Actinobacteria bacterium]|nr:hypothetical protein [Actinomycetota bacterium]HDL49621.1 hypothetical protein [Actinomycetota bacterium]
MKIAIHQSGPIGGRAASVLLAERRLDLLGLLDQDPAGDPRVVRVEDLSQWDVLVSDTSTPTTLLARAVAADIPLVLSAELAESASIPLFAEASLVAMARCLEYESDIDSSLVAITRPGTPLRKGTRVVFPPPIGSLKALRRRDGLLVAPTDGDWGGLIISGNRHSTGVADHAAFLAGIALAAAAIVMATSDLPIGAVRVEDVAGPYLDAAESAGLEIARFQRP